MILTYASGLLIFLVLLQSPFELSADLNMMMAIRKSVNNQGNGEVKEVCYCSTVIPSLSCNYLYYCTCSGYFVERPPRDALFRRIGGVL